MQFSFERPIYKDQVDSVLAEQGLAGHYIPLGSAYNAYLSGVYVHPGVPLPPGKAQEIEAAFRTLEKQLAAYETPDRNPNVIAAIAEEKVNILKEWEQGVLPRDAGQRTQIITSRLAHLGTAPQVEEIIHELTDRMSPQGGMPKMPAVATVNGAAHPPEAKATPYSDQAVSAARRHAYQQVELAARNDAACKPFLKNALNELADIAEIAQWQETFQPVFEALDSLRSAPPRSEQELLRQGLQAMAQHIREHPVAQAAPKTLRPLPETPQPDEAGVNVGRLKRDRVENTRYTRQQLKTAADAARLAVRQAVREEPAFTPFREEARQYVKDIVDHAATLAIQLDQPDRKHPTAPGHVVVYSLQRLSSPQRPTAAKLKRIAGSAMLDSLAATYPAAYEPVVEKYCPPDDAGTVRAALTEVAVAFANLEAKSQARNVTRFRKAAEWAAVALGEKTYNDFMGDLETASENARLHSTGQAR